MTFVTCGLAKIHAGLCIIIFRWRRPQHNPHWAERRRGGDRRKRSGRRGADQALDPQDQRASETIVSITAAIILAPRLKALELRDSVLMRNLIQEAVSLAKLILRKAAVELARDLAKDAGPPSR
jgi:hypothetical protein